MNQDLEATEVEAESLSQVVQQELEAMLPFTAKFRRGIEQLGEASVLLARTIARSVRRPLGLDAVAYQIGRASCRERV